eukprot:scaffold10246_cov101-Isochrysis_galbana.AAC.3
MCGSGPRDQRLKARSTPSGSLRSADTSDVSWASPSMPLSPAQNTTPLRPDATRASSCAAATLNVLRSKFISANPARLASGSSAHSAAAPRSPMPLPARLSALSEGMGVAISAAASASAPASPMWLPALRVPIRVASWMSTSSVALLSRSRRSMLDRLGRAATSATAPAAPRSLPNSLRYLSSGSGCAASIAASSTASASSRSRPNHRASSRVGSVSSCFRPTLEAMRAKDSVTIAELCCSSRRIKCLGPGLYYYLLEM